MTALVVIGVAVGMLLLVRSSPHVEPFDPRSSASNGATGAVLLLEDLGASVTVSSSAPKSGDDERVLVIADRLNKDQRADLVAFVESGGVAVVADPASTLHGATSAGAIAVSGAVTGDVFGEGDQRPADDEANVLRGLCTVRSLESLRGVFSPKGLLFPVSTTQQRCFGDAGHAFVIVRTIGAGVVVGLGDNNVITNGYLRYADNAGLVTALLAPTKDARVRIMIGTEAKPSVSDIGNGDETLIDLVRPGIWMALSQLALAFVVFCFARGIRPGRTVREPSPTPIAGNELILATSNLMQRAHHHQRAAWLIRGEFYRQLVGNFRTAPDISIDRLSELVAARTGIEASELQAVLIDDVAADPVDANATLLQLSERIDQLRRRLLTQETETR